MQKKVAEKHCEKLTSILNLNFRYLAVNVKETSVSQDYDIVITPDKGCIVCGDELKAIVRYCSQRKLNYYASMGPDFNAQITIF